jgi:benzoate-CoA ligase
MLERKPTAFDDKIHGADWRAWVDPEIPDAIAPTTLLLDRHLGTPVEHKTAVIVDGEATSYGALTKLVAAVSAGLNGIEVAPEDRILLFGTDSLDYVAMWLGAVRAGAVPAVVSDLYKAPDLLYFLCDTAVKFVFIDVEQLGKLVDIAAELPASLRTIIVRGAAPADLAGKLPGRTVVEFRAIRDGGTPAIPPCQRHRNDVT